MRVSRGCTKNHEHLPLYCSQSFSSNSHKKRDATTGHAVYVIECCTGDYCNNGSFPYLAPTKSVIGIENVNGDPVKFFTAVFGCIFIVLTIAAVVIIWMRKGHNKRLSDSRLQQDDAFFATEDLLKRTHACGDSTLRVSFDNIFILLEFCWLTISIHRNISINQSHLVRDPVCHCSFNEHSHVKLHCQNVSDVDVMVKCGGQFGMVRMSQLRFSSAVTKNRGNVKQRSIAQFYCDMRTFLATSALI